MDDLIIMASVANAGTESRRVYYSAEIASIMEEIRQKQEKERIHRQAIAEGRAAVRVAQERRRIHAAQRKARRRTNTIATLAGVIFALIMLVLPGLVSML